MLSTLLSRKIATSRFRALWLALLLLAPLAYAVAGYIYLKTNHNARVRLALDREETFAAAAAFLNSKGLSTTGWAQYCIVEEDNDLHFYYDLQARQAGAEDIFAQRYAPPLLIKVLLRKPDNSEQAEVHLAADGRPLGYTRTFWQPVPTGSASLAEAQQLAEAAWHARPEAQEASYHTASPKVEERTNRTNITRRFSWEWKLSKLPGLKAQTIISVRGNQVVSEYIEADLSNEYSKQHPRPDRRLMIVSQIGFWLALILMGILGINRFIKRARQKELSYQRIFFITIFTATVYNLFVILGDVVTYQTASNTAQPPPAWIILVSASLFWVLIGLFLGMAYGSGEGDIREAYPGKLTSLDAMILGKFFSRNVARSVVWGFALGGWLMLALQLNNLVWHSRPGTGEGFLPFVIFYAAFPLALIATSWQTDVILIVVIGLLLPLPFFRRRFQPHRRLGRWSQRLAQYLPQRWAENWTERCVIASLAVFAWIAAQTPQLTIRPWSSVLVLALIKMVVLLVAFFKFDLLTASVAIAIPFYTKMALTTALQPAASLRRDGVIALLFAVAVLLVEMYFVVKGRWYSDEEVRPMYAGLLAERLSLQAEVSAARVAQERLLPQTLPLAPSFTVAASCIPAREVGGDFYDFFEIGPQQLGILVAEGGGRGLGAALTIAYAKGFLMPKLSGQQSNSPSSGDDSPTEILRALQDKLTRMLPRDQNIGLAFAVLDTADGVLRYARTGKYPRILLGRADAKVTQPTLVTAAEEHEIKFTPHVQQSESADEVTPITIIEGRAELERGDQLLLFTGGLAEAWRSNQQQPAEAFAQMLAEATTSKSNADLQGSLMHSVNQSLKLVRKQDLGDDLTAVVVRVEHVGALVETAAPATS
jgi:hypothetical protein